MNTIIERQGAGREQQFQTIRETLPSGKVMMGDSASIASTGSVSPFELPTSARYFVQKGTSISSAFSVGPTTSNLFNPTQKKASDFITKSDDWISCVTEKDICGVPLLFETGPDHSIVMVVHKSETFLLVAKTPVFSILSQISRGCCDYILTVFVYCFLKAKTSPLAFDTMT